MSSSNYPKIAQLKTVDAFRQRCGELQIDLPLDEAPLSAAEGSPLGDDMQFGEFRVGNRWCIHPMEGWDAEADGSPSELTLRRWHNFGISGAKLIWGGEAAAVQRDGRANPRQTLAVPENLAGLRRLWETVEGAHRERFGSSDDLLLGLQLTHSGRFCRPHSKQLEPRIAYHHPLLDAKFGIDSADSSVVCSDDYLEQLIDNYETAAGLASQAGFRFVDVKACHGYLMHEFLSARPRQGKYGGDYEGRTRLLKTIVGRIRDRHPELMIGVRLSVFDSPPYHGDAVGEPMDYRGLLPYTLGFGLEPSDPLRENLDEPCRLIQELVQLGVAAINVSAGSPYYNPHIQRPAIFPPSDGYLPPEDPLVGVARQIAATRRCKEACPDVLLVGSGFTYLQDYLPHVAQAVVRKGWMDSVGLGRMVLAYPELPADSLSGRPLRRKLVCRTFSDCTTAPRNGLVSGCYPLDAYYKTRSEFETLKQLKQDARS